MLQDWENLARYDYFFTQLASSLCRLVGYLAGSGSSHGVKATKHSRLSSFAPNAVEWVCYTALVSSSRGFRMTWYELIISAKKPKKHVTVNVGSMHGMASALSFLDAKAKAGSLGATLSVYLYDEVELSSEILIELLHSIGADSSWVVTGTSYSVYLSEV